MTTADGRDASPEWTGVAVSAYSKSMRMIGANLDISHTHKFQLTQTVNADLSSRVSIT